MRDRIASILLYSLGLLTISLIVLNFYRESFQASSPQNPNPQPDKKSIPCPVGSFCPPVTDRYYLCPGGYYGATQGLKNPVCSGVCEAGRICDVGSTTAQGQKPCPPGFYCVPGTASSGAVTPILCPEGHFCPEGSKVPQLCPDGVYCPKGTAQL